MSEADPGEGKGPGYALVWGLVAALFGGLVAWAGLDGAIPWRAAAAVYAAIAGAWVWLMVTAPWAVKP